MEELAVTAAERDGLGEILLHDERVAHVDVDAQIRPVDFVDDRHAMADGGQQDVRARLERLVLHDDFLVAVIVGPLRQTFHQVVQRLSVVDLEGIIVAVLGRPVDHDLWLHVSGDVGCSLDQLHRLLAQLGIGVGELAEPPARIHPQVWAELNDL